MKRYGFLHEQICEIGNIECADANARKNKKNKYGINKHDKNHDSENIRLVQELLELKFSTSAYTTFTIYELKERLIYRLPYYPDRIVHHAIINIMEPIWVNTFIKHTYACIKGRGIHALVKDLDNVLKRDEEGTTYCLKLDIKKFYPSINHDILFNDIIKKKIKDKKLLTLLQNIIYSAPGIPIGNYLSQFFANLYLTYFDHWVKEELKCKYYFRYADDIVILHHDKEFLKRILISIKLYLKHVLKLEVKGNYQVFPVEKRGIDFVGYKFYHTHILLRKSIKSRLFKTIKKYENSKELQIHLTAYFGWLKYSNSKHLLTKIQLDTGIHYSNWKGKCSKITYFKNKHIRIYDVVKLTKQFQLNFIYNHKPYLLYSKNSKIFNYIKRNNLPLNLKIC